MIFKKNWKVFFITKHKKDEIFCYSKADGKTFFKLEKSKISKDFYSEAVFNSVRNKISGLSLFDFIDILLENKHHSESIKKILKIQDDVENLIPKDASSLFPVARSIKRHFVFHIGDTNTGKTFRAIEALKESRNGVYLAPLRLLALEVQEKLNEAGVPCSLLTGEEEDIIEGAVHIAQTVEKMNIDNIVDLAVIDEVQMIEDSQRGWA